MYDAMTGDANAVEAQIAHHVAAILGLLGLDPSADPELMGTPERVAQLAIEMTAGLREPPGIKPLAHPTTEHGLVVVRDIPFHSYCAHHLLPFFGLAHIGYVPGASIVGIGVPGRMLDHFAHRPQLQERLGEQVADFLVDELGALGVVVVIEARQLCLEMRGDRRRGVVETSAARGALVDGPVRREFFDRLGSRDGKRSDDTAI